MDIHPWPDGLGFRGGKEWWEFVRQQPDGDKIEILITMALLNNTVCKLLLAHDEDLFNRIGFSPCAIERLSAIQASTLEEFGIALTGQDYDCQ